MHIKIHTAAVPDGEVPITDAAAAAVRMGFNPSTLRNVDAMKALGAAMLSLCDEVADADPRSAAVAKTHIETAVMWAVKAATQGV